MASSLPQRLRPGQGSPDERAATARELGATAVAVVLGVVALLIGSAPSWTPLRWVVELAVGAVGVAAVRLRHRYPVLVALALVLALPVSDAVLGALLVALVALGASRRWWPVAGIGGLFVVSAAVQTSADPGSGTWWGGLALVAALFLACVVGGAYGAGRRDTLAALRAEAAAVRDAQTAREQRAVEEERTRIAREMHDVLAHRISLVAMHAGVLAFRTDLPPQDVARTAAVVRDNANLALLELRQVLGVLRSTTAGDTPEPPQPGVADLTDLIAEARQVGAVELRTEGDLEHVGSTTSRSAFRIVQEALTNARKHAPGSGVQVALTVTSTGSLVVEVVNGPAAGSSGGLPGSGTGLVGVAERVRLVGGTLVHGADGAGGYRLRAELPTTTGDR